MDPRKDATRQADRDRALGKLWDALQESGTLGSPEIDAEDIDTITTLHGAEDVPPPDDELIQRMWIHVQAGTMLQTLPTAGTAMNGRTAAMAIDAPELMAEPAALPRVGRKRETERLRHFVRTVGIGALAGFIAGVITLGGGGRIAMRIAAILSADELQGAVTANDERVGEITLNGTISLLITGGWIGVALGIGFVLIGAYLPGSGWRRVLASGAVFFAICGFVTLEGGNNTDYERFGIAGLNVCIFTLLPFLFGLMVAPLFDLLDRRLDAAAPRMSRSPGGLLTSVLLLSFTAMAFFGAIFLMVLPPLQLFLAMPVLIWLGRWVGERWSPSPVWATWSTRAAVALPCAFGLMLTAIAVGRIM
jgi:hypothetical protein